MGMLRSKKGPSAKEMARREEEARAKERARIDAENMQFESDQRKRAELSADADIEKRQRFASQLTEYGDDGDENKKFLKGV